MHRRGCEVFKDCIAGKIETRHEDPPSAIERAGRGNAKSARDNPIRAPWTAESTETLLLELIDSTPVVAARGE